MTTGALISKRACHVPARSTPWAKQSFCVFSYCNVLHCTLCTHASADLPVLWPTFPRSAYSGSYLLYLPYSFPLVLQPHLVATGSFIIFIYVMYLQPSKPVKS